MSFDHHDVLNAALDGNEPKLREMLSEDTPKVLAAKDEVRAWPGGLELSEGAGDSAGRPRCTWQLLPGTPRL